MKKTLWVVFLLMSAMAVPMMAKDKDYEDGTLLNMEKFHPDKSTVLYAMATGYHIKPTWTFLVKVGDWTYGMAIEKGWGGMNEAEWPANSPVQVRFDIHGGAVATRTKMHVKREDGKEVTGDVLMIGDKDGRTDYCGTRKCDPKSAMKKYEKEGGSAGK